MGINFVETKGKRLLLFFFFGMYLFLFNTKTFCTGVWPINNVVVTLGEQ